MMPMPLPRCHPLEIVVAPVLLAPASSFQYISLHISARRHNFYILANYFLGLGVLDFPPDKTQAKTHPLEALLSVGLAWPLFIFFFGCWLLLSFGMRGAKTKLTSITQCTRGIGGFPSRLYQSDTRLSPLGFFLPFACLCYY